MKPIDVPFTHIIVGAGSAGCLLANRLSARPENNVLLVEAGGWDQDFWLKLPVGYFRSINNPSVSRHFATTPCEGTAGPARRAAHLRCGGARHEAEGGRWRRAIWGHDFYLVRGACWSVI